MTDHPTTTPRQEPTPLDFPREVPLIAPDGSRYLLDYDEFGALALNREVPAVPARWEFLWGFDGNDDPEAAANNQMRTMGLALAPMPAERPNVEAIQARANAATPGPWEAGHNWVYTYPVYEDDTRLSNIFGMEYADSERAAVERVRATANIAFVAHARQDIPALLAYIARLEAEARAR